MRHSRAFQRQRNKQNLRRQRTKKFKWVEFCYTDPISQKNPISSFLLNFIYNAYISNLFLLLYQKYLLGQGKHIHISPFSAPFRPNPKPKPVIRITKILNLVGLDDRRRLMLYLADIILFLNFTILGFFPSFALFYSWYLFVFFNLQ